MATSEGAPKISVGSKIEKETLQVIQEEAQLRSIISDDDVSTSQLVRQAINDHIDAVDLEALREQAVEALRERESEEVPGELAR